MEKTYEAPRVDVIDFRSDDIVTDDAPVIGDQSNPWKEDIEDDI